MNINFIYIYIYTQFVLFILLNVCVSYYTKKRKKKKLIHDSILTIMDYPINI